MKRARKIITYVATSADGYIARPNGDVEWLNRLPSTTDHGMGKFYPTIDTILWGRKTYDWALAYHKKAGTKGSIFEKTVPDLLHFLAETSVEKRRLTWSLCSDPVKTFALATPRAS